MAESTLDTATPGRRRRRRVLWVVGVVAVAVVGAAAWIGVRALLAKGELEQVEALRESFTSALDARDAEALGASVAGVHDRASAAADLTSDPVWRASELLPGWGANASALRVASETMRDVTAAAEPLVTAAGDAADASSGLDVSIVAHLADPLTETSQAVDVAQGRLSGLDSDALVPQLRDGITELSAAIDGVAGPLSEAAAAAGVLPAMLGADEDRSILIMVQNTAEARTGGGLTGSFIELTASKGQLGFGATADSTDFTERDSDIISIPAATTALYGENVGRFVTNATMTPDFDLSAQLASAWWETLGHPAPDAVLSIDPVVLAALLEITGPITLADGGAVDASSVTERILVRPYLEDSQQGQTAIQADLTERLFDRLIATPLDVVSWADALARPVAEGRISIWSAHPAEEQVLSGGPFAGTLARYRAAGPQAVGVYVNDATTGKLGTFLDLGISVGSRVCRADGIAEVSVSTTLTSTATDAARDYPLWMTGGANPGRPGDISTDVTVEAPAGWYINGADIDGSPSPSTDVVDGDNALTRTRVVLAPGESKTATFHLLADLAGGTPTPSVVHTPLMNTVAVDAGGTLPCD